MKYTVVFPSQESTECVLFVEYTSAICWKNAKGEEAQFQLGPYYQPGEIQKACEKLGIENYPCAPKRVVIVAHEIGNGVPADLEKIKADLGEMGYKVATVTL